MASARNSIGVEIDESFRQSINPITCEIIQFSNDYIHDRIIRHFEFVNERLQNSKPLKYKNKHYGCPVVTSQEQHIIVNFLKETQTNKSDIFDVLYSPEPGPLVFDDYALTIAKEKMQSIKEQNQLNILDMQ